jgi:hypothetical protein
VGVKGMGKIGGNGEDAGEGERIEGNGEGKGMGVAYSVAFPFCDCAEAGGCWVHIFFGWGGEFGHGGSGS